MEILWAFLIVFRHIYFRMRIWAKLCKSSCILIGKMRWKNVFGELFFLNELFVCCNKKLGWMDNFAGKLNFRLFGDENQWKSCEFFKVWMHTEHAGIKGKRKCKFYCQISQKHDLMLHSSIKIWRQLTICWFLLLITFKLHWLIELT